ncbi:MAG: hypothetical protein JW973_01480 [Bacteroidales bacterium]|nr:hypothetical protein [Bacteroidales bacterium]
MKKLIYNCFLCSLISPLLYAQFSTMEISQLNVSDGLSQNYVSAILKDNKGFIWVGTFWGGLNRYDGYSFKVYKNNPNDINSLSSDDICTMYEDRNGVLWIGTWDGLNRFSPEEPGEKFICYRYSNSPVKGGNLVSSIYEDFTGKLWIGGGSHGVFSFDRKNGKFTYYKVNVDVPGTIDGNISSYISSIPDNNVAGYVCSITGDSDSVLWIGTTVGLNRLDRKNDVFKAYRPVPDDIENWSNSISSLHVDPSGKLWVGTGNGLFTFHKNDEKFTLQFKESKRYKTSRNTVICSIKEDNTGKLWVRTTEGLYNNDETNNTFIRCIHSEYPQEVWWELINTLYIESRDIIWFAYPGEGIKILTVKRKNFEFIKLESDDPKSMIFNRTSAVYEDKNGNIWFGSPGDGLKIYNPSDKRFSFYRHDPGDPLSICANTIYDIYQDKTGTIWIATSGGLNRTVLSCSGKIKFIRYLHDDANPASIASNNIWWVFEDEDNNLWLTDGTYLDRYNKENDSFIHLENELLRPDWINNENSCREVKGEIWFRSRYGLHRIIPPLKQTSTNCIRAEKVILYKNDPYDPNSLSNSWVVCMCYSHIYQPGTLWLGTYGGGLQKMVKKETNDPGINEFQFRHYTQNHGLPNDIVFEIFEDDHGFLWISTNNGLSKFNPEKETFRNYDARDGLPTNQFCAFSSFKNKNGKLFFTTGNGIVTFYPDSIKDNQVVPPVVITDFRLFNKSIKPGKNSPLKLSISYTKEIKLPYNQNYPGFEFAALNYINTSKNRYKYMLEGIDKDWVDAGNRRFVDYPDLKPGEYIFKVMGSNNDDVWNEEGATVRIVIRPPWWKTTVAYVSYGLLFIILLRAFIMLRTRRLAKEKAKLEQQVNERTIEIQQANEELHQQKEELQATLENLQKTQAQLIESEKMAALGGLVAGVAHEINTPVGITITAASGLLDETHKMAELFKEEKIRRADFKEFLNSSNHAVSLIMSNMERTAAMVQSFKQISVDQASETRRVFNVKDYTQDIIRSLYPKFRNRKITINLNIDGELKIDNYPGAYSQILTNLIINSLMHGFEEEQEGNIELTAASKDSELFIEYKDNGKGIAPENLKKVFDPFFTTNIKKGTGLGLHIVYNLVTQKMSGTIICESNQGEGVNFNIRIPMHN